MRGAAPLPAGETRLPGPRINAAAHARLAKKIYIIETGYHVFSIHRRPGPLINRHAPLS